MAAGNLSRAKQSGMRTALVLALIAPLSACVFNNPLDRQLTSSTILEPSPMDGYQYEMAEEVPLSRAFMELPTMAGPIIAAREKRYANGVEQVMILESEAAADGENRIEVRVVRTCKYSFLIRLSALPGWFQFIGDYKLLVYGGLLFIMMRFSPHGLAGMFRALARKKRAPQ